MARVTLSRPRLALRRNSSVLSLCPSSGAALRPRHPISIHFSIPTRGISSMSGFHRQSAGIVLLLAAMSPLLAGCDGTSQASAEAPPALPDVSIVTVKPQPRAMVRELPGRIAPTRVSEVRPRVSGIVVERMFSQGSEVKAGDPLYRIDPKPFEVEVQASKAALARAEAVYDRAVQQARRMSYLAKERAAPEIENEKAIAAEREAAAEVEGRKADLARANLNLDYATIRAPI